MVELGSVNVMVELGSLIVNGLFRKFKCKVQKRIKNYSRTKFDFKLIQYRFQNFLKESILPFYLFEIKQFLKCIYCC